MKDFSNVPGSGDRSDSNNVQTPAHFPKVLVTIPFLEHQKEKLRDVADGACLQFLPAKDLTAQLLAEADVIMGNVPTAQLCQAGQLKWIQLNSAGADAYCVPGVLRPETVLTCASGAYDISVSENMVAYTLVMMKRLYQYYDNQKKHLWQDEGDVMSAYQACVLVVGLGKIGLAYARRMKAMGSYVIGIRRNAGEVPEGVDEVYSMEELLHCLQRADVVACVLPGTPETKQMFGRKEFGAMKQSAYFLNAGRGNVVDLEALCDALEAGELAGAMLDVTEPEPLPPQHRAWETPRLFLTPHVAGQFHIPVTLDLISDICAENLRHYLNGEPLKNKVNREAGY